MSLWKNMIFGMVAISNVITKEILYIGDATGASEYLRDTLKCAEPEEALVIGTWDKIYLINTNLTKSDLE